MRAKRVNRSAWLDFTMKTKEIQTLQERAEGLSVFVDPLDRLPKNSSKKRMLEAVEQIEGMLFREECDRQGAVEALKGAIEEL